jgi:hypothetical protein
MRLYEFILDEAERFAYHGGSYAGGEYDPNKKGEPGNLRPLGGGLYAAETPEHAQIYVKYGGSNGKVTKFKVNDNARLYPWGGGAWSETSPEEQEFWKEKSKEIQAAFDKENLGYKGKSWQNLVSDISTSGQRDRIRKLLASLGVDGSRQRIGSNMVELVFYNTNVLSPVSED